MSAGEGAFAAATGRALEDGGAAADRRRYRAYQKELIAPHVGDSFLEVGAGQGDFAAQFTTLSRVVVTDVDPAAVSSMTRRFAHQRYFEARVFDLADPSTWNVGPPVSAVVAINVLEHIEDDAAALAKLAALVQPGGRVVMFVPGYQQLYGDFDRAVGHVRRYTPATLRSAYVRAGLRPVSVRPVNFLGGIAWWATVRRGGVGTPNPRLVRAYDRFLVPATRMLEKRITPPFGQSVLGVAEVPVSKVLESWSVSAPVSSDTCLSRNPPLTSSSRSSPVGDSAPPAMGVPTRDALAVGLGTHRPCH